MASEIVDCVIKMFRYLFYKYKKKEEYTMQSFDEHFQTKEALDEYWVINEYKKSKNSHDQPRSCKENSDGSAHRSSSTVETSGPNRCDSQSINNNNHNQSLKMDL